MFAAIYPKNHLEKAVYLENQKRMDNKFFKDVISEAFYMACISYEYDHLRINFYKSSEDSNPLFYFNMHTVNYGETIIAYLHSPIIGLMRSMIVAE